jgi:hypothetical protein
VYPSLVSLAEASLDRQTPWTVLKGPWPFNEKPVWATGPALFVPPKVPLCNHRGLATALDVALRYRSLPRRVNTREAPRRVMIYYLQACRALRKKCTAVHVAALFVSCGQTRPERRAVKVARHATSRVNDGNERFSQCFEGLLPGARPSRPDACRRARPSLVYTRRRALSLRVSSCGKKNSLLSRTYLPAPGEEDKGGLGTRKSRPGTYHPGHRHGAVRSATTPRGSRPLVVGRSRIPRTGDHHSQIPRHAVGFPVRLRKGPLPRGCAHRTAPRPLRHFWRHQ